MKLSSVVITVLTLTTLSSTLYAHSSGPRRVKPYPLKTCIVSGEELGSMGKPKYAIYKMQRIKFCCKPCLKKFKKNRKKYLKLLQDKVAKQK